MADTVLEEVFDPNYEPTQKEIEEYAEFLGMNLEVDVDFLWIAREGLKAPLPPQWKPCQTDSGEVYYFNFTTKESIWEHPCDEYYRKMYLREVAKVRGKPLSDDNEISHGNKSDGKDSSVDKKSNTSMEENVPAESLNKVPSPAQFNELPTLPKLVPISGPALTNPTGLPLPSTIMHRLSSREMPPPSQTQSRQGSLRDEDGEITRARTGSQSSQSHSHLSHSSAKLTKLKSMTDSNGVTPNQSKLQLNDKDKSNINRSRTSSQVSLSSPRISGLSLPSLHSSVPQIEDMQKRLEDQSAHVSHLESELLELRNRVRVADELLVETKSKHQRELQTALANAHEQSDCTVNALRDGLIKSHTVELQTLREKYDAKVNVLENQAEKYSQELHAEKHRTLQLEKQNDLALKELQRKHDEQIEVLKQNHRDEVELAQQQISKLKQKLDIQTTKHKTEQIDSSALETELSRVTNKLSEVHIALKEAEGQVVDYRTQMTTIKSQCDTLIQARDEELFTLRTRIQTLEQIANQLQQEGQVIPTAQTIPADPASTLSPETKTLGTQTDNIPFNVQEAFIETDHQVHRRSSSTSTCQSNGLDTPSSVSSLNSYTLSHSQLSKFHHRGRKMMDESNHQNDVRNLRSPSLKRPPLLKSRITSQDSPDIRPGYLETVTIPEVDDELRVVQASLNEVMNRIQSRRLKARTTHSPTLQQVHIPSVSPVSNRFDISNNDALSKLSSRPITSFHDLDSLAAECTTTQRKLREHTSWLRTFLDQLDPTFDV